MSKNTGIFELGQRIEELVRGYMAEVREGAKAALEQALAGGKVSLPATAPMVREAGARRARKSGDRREQEAVAALAERFYEILCETPGETMVVLASKVGATPRALHLPVAKLKRTGRVRSVGERQRTRYFPMRADHATA